MTDPDPSAPGPSVSPEGNGATSSSFISNVPLPPRLHLGGNLSENWKQWKQIYDAYETVTNLKSKPDNFRVAAFITCKDRKLSIYTIHFRTRMRVNVRTLREFLHYGMLTVLVKQM